MKNDPKQSTSNQSMYSWLLSRRVTTRSSSILLCLSNGCVYSGRSTESKGPAERKRRRKKKHLAYQRLTQERQLIINSHSTIFFSGKSPPTAFVRYPTKTHLISGKNNISYMSLAYKNGTWYRPLLLESETVSHQITTNISYTVFMTLSLVVNGN